MTTDGFDLRIDDLSLMRNDLGACTINTQGEGATFGNAVPVTAVMESLLRDGDLTVTNRDGNREASFMVEIGGPDEGAIDSGEAELMSRLDRAATLTYQRPYAADTLLDVVVSRSELIFNDLEMIRAHKRTFRVVFECLPYARSADTVTINYTGPGTQVTDLSSTAGWTVVGAGALEAGTDASGNRYIRHTTAGAIVVKRTFVLDSYLRLAADQSGFSSAIDTVSVGGVALDPATFRVETGSSIDRVTIPTEAWRGTSAEVQFTIQQGTVTGLATLYSIYTTTYPNKGAGADFVGTGIALPGGPGVIDVPGSARSPIVLLTFTAPTGGAFVYTAPDPNIALRDKGAIENQYEKWTVAAGDPVYLPGDYVRVTLTSDPQPVVLNPDGIWPQLATTVHKFAHPRARGTAVSYFPAGTVQMVSASIDLPTGYHPAAMVHEEHVLHPGRCGFAVIAADTGLPIAATLTFYPHWKHHAGQ